MVLACARKVFSEKGYHSAGVSDIVEAAGVARGTFYLYFAGKRAIFDELLDSLFAELESKIRRVDPSAGADGIAREMAENVGRVFDALLRNRDITRILLREAVGLDAGLDRKLEEFYGRIAGLIERSLRTGQEMGIVRPVDPRVGALIVLGAVRQVLDHSLAAPDTTPDGEALARSLLDIMVRGLVCPGAISPPSGLSGSIP